MQTINDLLSNLSDQQVQEILGRSVHGVSNLGDRSYEMDSTVERNGKLEQITLWVKFYTIGKEIDYSEKWSEKV